MEFAHWLNVALPAAIAGGVSIAIAILARRPNAAMIANKLNKAEETLLRREEALRESLFRQISHLEVKLRECEQRHDETENQLIVEIDARQELEARCRRLEDQIKGSQRPSIVNQRGDTS